MNFMNFRLKLGAQMCVLEVVSLVQEIITNELEIHE